MPAACRQHASCPGCCRLGFLQVDWDKGAAPAHLVPLRVAVLFRKPHTVVLQVDWDKGAALAHLLGGSHF